MAYDTETLKKKALKAIKEHDLIFVEDVIAYLPCSKPTFYEHFPVEAEEDKPNELNYIKERLEENRVRTKVAMRKKWLDSNNATLQMGLMKLLSSDEELKKLSMQAIDHSSSDGSMSPRTLDDFYREVNDEGNDESSP